MRSSHLLVAWALVAGLGCAKSDLSPDADPFAPDARNPNDPDANPNTPDAGCGATCDTDGDGVLDVNDQCPGTPSGEPVNQKGCSESQLTPTLNDTFPPYGLTWTPTGDPGRAGGLTWTYTAILRGDLFHIYWIVCDDPASTCGLSLDGAIDDPGEEWLFSAVDSDLPAGKLAYVNTTRILLADSTTVALTGRLTFTITDAAQVPIPAADAGSLGVPTRHATHGAEIPGTGFVVTVLAEVKDAASAWTPYLDYYDAASTPDPAQAAISFSGFFYDE